MCSSASHRHVASASTAFGRCRYAAEAIARARYARSRPPCVLRYKGSAGRRKPYRACRVQAGEIMRAEQ